MKQMKKRILAFFAALTLILSLAAACGGDSDSPAPAPDPAPAADDAEQDSQPPVSDPGPDQEDDKQEAAVPADSNPAGDEEPADVQTEEPEPEPEPASHPIELETQPDSEPEPEPDPEPEPEPEPEPDPEPVETAPADGTYTASVTLEGGTGRATVESPATLHCKDGQFTAVIVWSSPNFDYMKVDGQRYDMINTEGNSTFEIPVAAFDQALPVVADTIAMSEPHEVEYTLTFDSNTLQIQ